MAANEWMMDADVWYFGVTKAEPCMKTAGWNMGGNWYYLGQSGAM